MRKEIKFSRERHSGEIRPLEASDRDSLTRRFSNQAKRASESAPGSSVSREISQSFAAKSGALDVEARVAATPSHPATRPTIRRVQARA